MSINRIVLVGNLTRDPELRELPSGNSVCHLRVACSRLRRTDDGGWEEKPNYFDVSVFGNQATNVHRYLKKGRPVGIDGRLEWREWETADQQKRQSVNIVAETVQFLGSPDGGRHGEEPDAKELAAVGAMAAIDEGDDELGF